MKIASVRAFAQVREEIWFWPAAVLAYALTSNDSVLLMIGFVVSLLTGATTYKLHEIIREVFEEQKNISQVRRRVSRESKGESSIFSLETFQVLFNYVGPSRPASQFAVVGGMLLNILLFFVLYFWLIVRVGQSAYPTLTEMSLISLPLLIIAIIVSSVVWNS